MAPPVFFFFFFFFVVVVFCRGVYKTLVAILKPGEV